ncbi:glycosyltransferase family 2 protein [Cryobacterium sp. Y11]|uniref:glycosyltransferase family 2 protein n=1 Tax=Cryobacterium sp. Y11 TaxID=2045016 RepID=UPI001304B236|nr:glycosyltransferase family 2 protein [Cryobacterium sp. Y11]
MSIVGRTEKPWCSLITVTYNSRRALEEFWGKNDKVPAGVEWIVVDNCSTDGSADVAESLGATGVIRLTENLGFASSNNRGLKAAQGTFIGFVNPDVRVRYADLKMLEQVANERQAVVSPQLVNADGTLQPNGRGFPFLWHKVRNRLGPEKKLRGSYLLFSDNDEPRMVCWLMGASVFGLRTSIEKFGAWDSHFFLYYEDKDFSLRAWKADIPVALVPRAKWTHGWARETSSLNAMPWKRELGSMFKFYRRYPEFLMPKGIAVRKHPRINREVYGALE